MKRRSFIAAAGAASLTAGFAGAGLAENTAGKGLSLVETPQKRADYLAQMLKALCTDIGPHPIGSEAYNKAARIVRKEMERSLPLVEEGSFTYERWRHKGEQHLTVGGEELEAYLSHGTSGTPPEGVSGVLRKNPDSPLYIVVDPQTAEEKAYIAVYDLGTARPRPNYSFGKERKCPPIVTIGKPDTEVLDEVVKSQAPVKLIAEAEFIPDTPTCNVVGSIPGKSNDEIVFLAHLDTVYNSPGANDNTASLIIMLMLAHACSGMQPAKTLTFIATTGEEYGKEGAVHYVAKRTDAGTLRAIKYLVNFDSVTWGHIVQIYTKDAELRSMFSAIDRDLNLPCRLEFHDEDGFMLDGKPFSESGARAVYANSRGYDNTIYCWHRPFDTPENVPVNTVEMNFLLFREFIKRVQEQ